MNKSLGLIILYVSVVSIFGCKKSEDLPQNQANAQKSEVTLSNLDERLTKLEISDLYSNLEQFAYINVTEKQFSIIKANIGTIAFVVDDVKPYANGSKVKLIIGNTTNASLKDVKFTIEYGALDGKSNPINETQKAKEVSLVGELKKGTWNKEEIILGGVSSESLGFVRIKDFNYGSIWLNNF